MITTEPISRVTDVFGTDSGAVLAFYGVVRSRNEGRAVRQIDYEAYTPMAETVMSSVADDARGRFDVTAVEITHRVGVVRAGEASLRVVVRARHRGPAIEALSWVVTEIKNRVPIWKREHYDDDTARWL